MYATCRGIVQLTNQAACDTLGFHRNDLVGRNVNQIIPP
jgi:PAS domain S-box-containing protein